jgi:hypothetical protein
LIVINGGAAIAILTFLGGVASKEKIDFTKVGAVADTIRYFATGVALALVGMVLSYFTNFLWPELRGPSGESGSIRIWKTLSARNECGGLTAFSTSPRS